MSSRHPRSATSNFDRIPDNVLLNIIRRLPWREQARVRRVNPRFASVADLSVALKIKEIDIRRWSPIPFRRVGKEYCKRLLHTVADKLESLNLTDILTPQDLAEITKFRTFRSLRKLDISWRGVSFVTLMGILEKCPNVEELHAYVWCWRGSTNARYHEVHPRLQSLHVSGSITDPKLMLMAKLFPKLRNVSLLPAYLAPEDGGRRLPLVTNTCLSSFVLRYGPRLENLTISSTNLHYRERTFRVTPFQALGAFDGVEHCTNLRRLHLIEADFVLSKQFVNALVRGCTKVEEIRIADSEGLYDGLLSKFASLPRLKRLSLENMPLTFLNDGIMDIAMEGRLEQLCVYNTSVSVESLKVCVRSCMQLSYLNLNEYRRLTSADCLEIAELYERYGRAPRLLIRSNQKHIWREDFEFHDAQMRIRQTGHKRLIIDCQRSTGGPGFLEERAQGVAQEEIPPGFIRIEGRNDFWESSDEEVEEEVSDDEDGIVGDEGCSIM